MSLFIYMSLNKRHADSKRSFALERRVAMTSEGKRSGVCAAESNAADTCCPRPLVEKDKGGSKTFIASNAGGHAGQCGRLCGFL